MAAYRRVYDLRHLQADCPAVIHSNKRIEACRALNFSSLSSEKSAKTRHLTVKFLSADFTAASKNSGKNPCCLLKIDITSLMDANENEHTRLFFVIGDEIYDMPLLN